MTMSKRSGQFGRYYRAVEFIDSLQNMPRDEYMVNLKLRGKKAEVYLSRMRGLLDAWGNPERGMKMIHVAGTSGKG